MKTNAFLYSSKVWLTAIFITPFVQYLIDSFTSPYGSNGFWVFYSVSIGVILAFPSLILFWLLMLCLKKLASITVLVKLLLTIAGILLSVLMFYFSSNQQQFSTESQYFPIPYLIIIVCSIWMYELPVLDSERYREQVNA